MLEALQNAIARTGRRVYRTNGYRGASQWLVLFGIGTVIHEAARRQQLARGGRTLIWDLGYFEDRKRCLRMSIDADHPQHWLDRTHGEPRRWAQHGINLRYDYDPTGPIILVGLGRKSRAYLDGWGKTGSYAHWELAQLARLNAHFPGRRVIHRPKSARDLLELPCERDETTPIEQLLRGASLAVCRHSNVAVDAAIAGVPFEAEDGAAVWLAQRPFTPDNRLDFLRRLSWWEWGPDEAAEAWQFAQRISA